MSALTPASAGLYNSAQAHGSYMSAVAVRGDMTYRQASDIVIHTLEGDTVTLSSSTHEAGGYETYESLASGGGMSASRYGETAYFESRSQISISVTGDLSREELEEINGILGTLDGMMKDLTAGNLEGALSKSSQFAEMEAIASFSADLSITATLTASRFETAATSPSAPQTRIDDRDTLAWIDRMADEMLSALKPRTALLEYLVPEIDASLSSWLDGTQAQSGDQAEGSKQARRFARRLMDGLKPDLPHEKMG